jgi:hypothetical protein
VSVESNGNCSSDVLRLMMLVYLSAQHSPGAIDIGKMEAYEGLI